VTSFKARWLDAFSTSRGMMEYLTFDPVAMLGARDLQVVRGLEIEPELRRGAKETPEAKRRLSGNGTLTLQDRGDSIGGNAQGTGQRVGGQRNVVHPIAKDLPRKNGWEIGSASLNDARKIDSPCLDILARCYHG
jgi:hypothetical protein